MKSGTSLLRKMISLHPNIFGGLETHWFSDEFNNDWQSGVSKRQQWLLEFYDVSEEEAAVLRLEAQSSKEFFNSFMEFCSNRVGKKRWVEKTPDNVFHISEIFSSWPKSNVLIMTRNLLDVYASWKKNDKGSLKRFLQTVEEFNSTVGRFSMDPRVFIIRYSDLVSEPSSTLKSVFKFLGEEYIEGLENYQGDDSDYKKVLSVTGKASPTTVSLSKPIFTSSLGSWKEVLTSKEVREIEPYNSF